VVLEASSSAHNFSQKTFRKSTVGAIFHQEDCVPGVQPLLVENREVDERKAEEPIEQRNVEADFEAPSEMRPGSQEVSRACAVTRAKIYVECQSSRMRGTKHVAASFWDLESTKAVRKNEILGMRLIFRPPPAATLPSADTGSTGSRIRRSCVRAHSSDSAH
jgi:hypothetical protein